MHIHLNLKSMKFRHVYIQVFADIFFVTTQLHLFFLHGLVN